MSLAQRLIDHGLAHLTLRDLAKIEECFGVELVTVSQPEAEVIPPLAEDQRAHPIDTTYALAC